jgi:mannose-6-phosphate isomerase-like protein (cupin superfamily)
MDIWNKQFNASYTREDGVVVLNDKDIPLPDGFAHDPGLRSSVMFPPHTRAGDHYHSRRHEVFVGFGEGMELMVEDRETKEVKVFKMDPVFNQGKCVVFWMKPGMPHTVRNGGNIPGYLIEFASSEPEKVEYVIKAEDPL